MKRVVIFYLIFCAFAEVLILLMARGLARTFLVQWKYNNSISDDLTIFPLTEMAPMVSTVALVIPFILIVLALVYASEKLKDPKTAFHAIALSIIACAAVSFWTQVSAFLRGIGYSSIPSDQFQKLCEN